MKNNGDNLILGCEEMNDKYPYIGKSILTHRVALFVSDYYGVIIEGVDTGLEMYWGENKFTDITREYLANTKIKALSEEHSEMIQKLAFNAGYKWASGDTELRFGYKYLFIYEDGYITKSDDINFIDHPHKEIFLPMPESKVESEEVPLWSVGDEVEFPSGRGVLALSEPDDNGVVIVKSDDPEFGLVYKIVSIHSISKPKTEKDIVKEALIEYVEDVGAPAQIIVKRILKRFNVTEK